MACSLTSDLCLGCYVGHPPVLSASHVILPCSVLLNWRLLHPKPKACALWWPSSPNPQTSWNHTSAFASSNEARLKPAVLCPSQVSHLRVWGRSGGPCSPHIYNLNNLLSQHTQLQGSRCHCRTPSLPLACAFRLYQHSQCLHVGPPPAQWACVLGGACPTSPHSAHSSHTSLCPDAGCSL